MENLDNLAQAKKGSTQAIAALLNRSLQSKGITAKASLKESCLQVMLESNQVPAQQASVALIRQEMRKLGAPTITTVKIYGKQTGVQAPAWTEEFELSGQANSQISQDEPPLTSSQNKPKNLSNSKSLSSTKLLHKNDGIQQKPLISTTYLVVSSISIIISLVFLTINPDTNQFNNAVCNFLAIVSFVSLVYALLVSRKATNFKQIARNWGCSFNVLFFGFVISLIIYSSFRPTVSPEPTTSSTSPEPELINSIDKQYGYRPQFIEWGCNPIGNRISCGQALTVPDLAWNSLSQEQRTVLISYAQSRGAQAIIIGVVKSPTNISLDNTVWGE